MATTVGLIGLGNIGMPMAEILIGAGYDVVGYRRSPSPEFEAMGGRRADSPRAVAEATDLILCCIPGDDALRAVISGPDGIASGDCTGKVVAELSTLGIETKRAEADKLAEAGGVLLDGAISGLPPMVAARTAVYMLSGDEDAYARIRPVLETLSDKLFLMGEFGAGTNTKLCANMLVAANIASVAETLAFGAKLGIDAEALIAALKDGAGGSIQFHARAARMATGDWDKVLASTAILMKDIKLIEAKGDELGVAMPVLSSTRPFYEKTMEDGLGEKDVAAVYATFAQAAGLPVPKKDKD